MTGRVHAWFIVLAATNGACAIAGDVAPSLRHEPFVRPPLASASASSASGGDITAREWKPKLRGVITAAKGSLVNVDGMILSLGEQIEGFRLMRVEERKAVFMKNGVRIELTIDDPAVDTR